MLLQVREIDPETEREPFLSLARQNLPDHGGDQRFEWLYLSNPSGVARAWLMIDAESASAVGVAAAFPRSFYVRGRAVDGWVLGDFAVRPEYRSLGPAVRLQRGCLEPVMTGKIAFAYDHPHSAMMPIYRWLGVEQTGRIIRLAKPIRLDGKFERFGAWRPIEKGIVEVGNLVLELFDSGRKATHGKIRVEHDVRVDDRFDVLDRNLADRYVVTGRRDAAFLRWRFESNPDATYRVMAAVDDAQVHGYAVVRDEGSHRSIVDLRCEDEEILAGIVMSVVREARAEELTTVDCQVLDGTRLVQSLGRLGFRQRETSPFVVATAKGGPLEGIVSDPDGWNWTQGDRDV